jgi:hypothetical protein
MFNGVSAFTSSPLRLPYECLSYRVNFNEKLIMGP